MFKNRVRTAALAGAVAIATGLSGFAAPAFAQDTTQQGGFRLEDGSKAVVVEPKNTSPKVLKDLTDETAVYLNGITGNPDNHLYANLVDFFLTLGDDVDPSEEAAAQTFAQARAEAEAELAKASDNVLEARASVKYAAEKDRIATADYDALIALLAPFVHTVGDLNDVNDWIDRVNDLNTHVEFEELDNINTPTRDNAVAVYQSVLALKAKVDDQVKMAGDWNIDKEDGRYVNNEHMKALLSLQALINEGVAEFTPAYEKAVASNIEAQLTNVLPRQLLLERAVAQRDTLRVLKSQFAVMERYFELYQNNELVTVDRTLRTEYIELLGGLHQGILMNVGFLQEADAAVTDYFESLAANGYDDWEYDQATNLDGYLEIKRQFALETYAKAVLNGVVWQHELDRVELIDLALKDEREAAAKAAADRDRELKAAEELAEAQKAIADALAKDKVDGGQSTTKPGTSSFKLSS
ncbi:hypothetical protein B842_11160 [Corynebacterium humireducens NBRC 106098 = DSM 45392]|uniref:Secreted protein n=1 Tax=Corynebacterium humireducens NBRC 106098 = DSM 45392 TaxID=1223515 RepID=A0A0B5DEB8_9CORY|nr:hypothetical protein [Corynebacterium humireducens]AJE34079.1 hypothetical protein B842_11160 [Corynebacterium humireducens NBRC 106098 = DSM 45392]